MAFTDLKVPKALTRPFGPTSPGGRGTAFAALGAAAPERPSPPGRGRPEGPGEGSGFESKLRHYSGFFAYVPFLKWL
jgi:hypothetical protein